jgi:glycosyltransferase involved in cell wall biosynthesis
MILGWSGSHSTAPFLSLLKEVLLDLRKEFDFKLLVMGDANFQMEGVDVTAIAWSESAEIPTLQQFDIGLYPLPLDSEWVLGKSGLKALQYMAVGVPVIATAIGANHRIMVHEETGLLVTSTEEWCNALKALMNNASMRKKIGQAGRENVVKNYSVTATAPVYLSILRENAR